MPVTATNYSMTKTYRHWDADYTPNDIAPPDKVREETRSAKEVGDSELRNIREWAEIKNDEMIYD